MDSGKLEGTSGRLQVKPGKGKSRMSVTAVPLPMAHTTAIVRSPVPAAAGRRTDEGRGAG
jgi:hypothetical protein